MMIYLAPIQGFTDFVYRKAFAETFPGVDAFFIPYISLKNETILPKHFKEILPENNGQSRVVPQVLANSDGELATLVKILKDFGYSEINLNMGCPYPMVTNRGKGAGLLPFPDKIKSLLSGFFETTDLKLSVKLRAGLVSPKETEQIIPVLNQFPLTEIIVHPRIAKQLYSGETDSPLFQWVSQNCTHPVVYNGDIFSVAAFSEKRGLFPGTTTWMLGRGVLMNPFLPAEIKGVLFSEEEKRTKLEAFHQRIFELYSENTDNPGNTLNKMKQFWSYFSYVFPDQLKSLKLIKKTRVISDFKGEVCRVFNSFMFMKEKGRL